MRRKWIDAMTHNVASECSDNWTELYVFFSLFFNPHDIILSTCVFVCRGQTAWGSFGCTSRGQYSVGRRSCRRSKSLWKRSAVRLMEHGGARGGHSLTVAPAFPSAEVWIAETGGHRWDVGHHHDQDQHAVPARRPKPGHLQGLADPHQLQDPETRFYQRQTVPVSACSTMRTHTGRLLAVTFVRSVLIQSIYSIVSE